MLKSVFCVLKSFELFIFNHLTLFPPGTEENREAFHRHFERELAIYGHQCIISLVEKNGKEKIIGDAYTNQINQLNDNRLTYVTFDFHEQW